MVEGETNHIIRVLSVFNQSAISLLSLFVCLSLYSCRKNHKHKKLIPGNRNLIAIIFQHPLASFYSSGSLPPPLPTPLRPSDTTSHTSKKKHNTYTPQQKKQCASIHCLLLLREKPTVRSLHQLCIVRLLPSHRVSYKNDPSR